MQTKLLKAILYKQTTFHEQNNALIIYHRIIIVFYYSNLTKNYKMTFLFSRKPHKMHKICKKNVTKQISTKPIIITTEITTDDAINSHTNQERNCQ